MNTIEELLGTPQSRVEACLKNCLEGRGTKGLPPPTSRCEVYLHALAEKIATLEAAVKEYHPCRLWLGSGIEAFEDYCSITLVMNDGSEMGMMNGDFDASGDGGQFYYTHSDGNEYWGWIYYNLKDVAKVRIEGEGNVMHVVQNGVEYDDTFIELDANSDIYLLYAD